MSAQPPVTPFPQGVPTLKRDGVTLRAHRPDDAAGCLEQCRDPLSRRWTTVPLDYTYLDAQDFVLRAMPAGWTEGSEWGFAVEAVADDGTPRYAGTVSLRDERLGRAEVAYGAHPWARGRGVMETALRLLLEWGFAERGLRTVMWWAHRGNWASRKLAWRLGFTVEGGARQWLHQRGELRDGWVGTLLAGDPMAPATPWYDVPHVGGDRVVLRPHRAEDAPRIVEACSDPETWGWIGSVPHPYTAADAERYLTSREEEHAAGAAVSWAVGDPGTGRLLGSLQLFRIVAGMDAEIGYWVHPDARGRGVATEACRLALRHAVVPAEDGGLGLQRVRAVVADGNAASLRVLAAAGLRVQGRERRAIRTGCGVRDAVVLDVLAEEVGAGPARPVGAGR
jgi:RimJ/RimL family protein N-acetyltransferase